MPGGMRESQGGKTDTHEPCAALKMPLAFLFVSATIGEVLRRARCLASLAGGSLLAARAPTLHVELAA
jgi:hypothetical protein